MNDDLKYPVGRFDAKQPEVAHEARAAIIDSIAAAPARLRAAVDGLTEAQLDTPYRDGGWTVRQVVHHVPDSHMNGYVRFKLGLTEGNPLIKPSEEAAWATLADSRITPIEVSQQILDAVQTRWVLLLRSMSDQDF